jgi:hypothetical protein
MAAFRRQRRAATRFSIGKSQNRQLHEPVDFGIEYCWPI